MVKIAIEATGGDRGFPVKLEGARDALEENSNLEIILVAGKDKFPNIPVDISLEITKNTYSSKEDFKTSSIYKSIEMHKVGDVDAVIAPGDTIATILASLKILGRLTKNSVPAIPTHWPFNNVLIDSGAKVDCNPKDLLQFAIMGKVFSENYLKVEKPLIGLLANGRESSKGDALVKASRPLIEKLKNLDYNISNEYFEGEIVGDLNKGWVAVTHGHYGNIILKTAETAFMASLEILYDKIKKQSYQKMVAAKYGIANPLKELRKEFDWRTFSTNPLLGFNGNIMIAHGKSDAKAIKNAILITEKYFKANINEKLKEEIRIYGKI